VASLEGDNLLIFYYVSTSETWPNKGGGLWGEGPYKRETTVLLYLYKSKQ